MISRHVIKITRSTVFFLVQLDSGIFCQKTVLLWLMFWIDLANTKLKDNFNFWAHKCFLSLLPSFSFKSISWSGLRALYEVNSNYKNKHFFSLSLKDFKFTFQKKPWKLTYSPAITHTHKHKQVLLI